MLRLGLIGKNISHSKSESVYKKIIKTKFQYDLLDYTSREDIPLLKNLLQDYQGLSITSPFKTSFNDQIKDLSHLGIVNCLRLNGEDIEAINTDYQAVQKILFRYLSSGVTNIKILGSGSMSKICQNILSSSNTDFQTYARNEKNLEKIFESDFKPDFSYLVINTCSREFIFSNSTIERYHFWDMNYGMDSHQKLFSRINVAYADGIEQLELQAKYALSFWNLE